MIDAPTIQRRRRLTPLLVSLATLARGAAAFSSQPSPYSLSGERFRASCPADVSAVAQYDPSLIAGDDADDDDTWVAVFRSSNNLPSVLIRDDLMAAMRIATTVQGDSAVGGSASSSSVSPDLETPDSAANAGGGGDGVKAATPVAVARLSKSEDLPEKYVIGALRCSFKKEDLNEDCDGGSEYCEAIAVCVDELILRHLTRQSGGDDEEEVNFDGALRCKATGYTKVVLEERGFVENTKLEKDMATHISSLDGSMEKYAERAVSTTVAKNSGARDRALQILSSLGRLNRKADLDKGKEGDDSTGTPGFGEEGYDPWAGSDIFKL